MAYPTSIDAFPTRADGVDTIVAADHNNLAAAIVATETELGTDPSGAFATVADRIAALEAGSGAEMWRVATATVDTASGIRTMAGFDTVGTVSAGYTATLGTSGITVPSAGRYLVTVHARFSAAYTGGPAILYVTDGTNDLVRGDQFTSGTGGIVDLNVTGVTPAISASTVIYPVIYTGTSSSLIGNAAGTYYHFRVAKI